MLRRPKSPRRKIEKGYWKEMVHCKMQILFTSIIKHDLAKTEHVIHQPLMKLPHKRS